MYMGRSKILDNMGKAGWRDQILKAQSKEFIDGIRDSREFDTWE